MASHMSSYENYTNPVMIDGNSIPRLFIPERLYIQELFSYKNIGGSGDLDIQ